MHDILWKQKTVKKKKTKHVGWVRIFKVASLWFGTFGSHSSEAGVEMIERLCGIWETNWPIPAYQQSGVHCGFIYLSLKGQYL